MKSITFEINSNEELWTLTDQKLNHIFIHKFMPNERITWWNTDIKLNNNTFKDLRVRNMAFDIQTDLKGLKRVLALNTNQLRIYQFEKPIPHTLSIEYLPQDNVENILIQNGLKHSFFCDFEFLTVSSICDDYLREIEHNEQFRKRIELRKNPINKTVVQI